MNPDANKTINPFLIDLLCELPPDTVVWRLMDGPITADMMIKAIALSNFTKVALADEYKTEVFRVVRDMISRSARKE